MQYLTDTEFPPRRDAFFRFLQSALVLTSLLYSISHTSLARVFSVFSSEARDAFFRFLQSALVQTSLLQSISRPASSSNSRIPSEEHEVRSLNSRLLWYQSLPCRPGFVVGSGVCGWPGHCFKLPGFITKGRYSSTELPTSSEYSKERQLKRTRPLTSFPVSQLRVLPAKLWSWWPVFTDQEGRKCVLQNPRLLWLQSLLCRPGLVVGSGVFVDCKVAG